MIHSNELALCEAAPSTSSAADEIETFASYNLNATLRGDESSNPYIGPGDIVSLPEAEQVYVIGNVFKPSSIPLKEQITVSQALAMAGGTLPDTKKNRIRIVRQIAGSKNKTEVIVDLEAINKHQADDVALQANDIVDVPTSTGKKILSSLINVIAPTATQLPLRVVRGY